MKTRVGHIKEGLEGVYIGRPGPYGNPYKIGVDGSRTTVIEMFRSYLRTQPALVTLIRAELKGRVLLCYCAPKPCHGDVIAAVADGAEP